MARNSQDVEVKPSTVSHDSSADGQSPAAQAAEPAANATAQHNLEARARAVARQRDAKTDRMVQNLRDGDQQLASLLSQAADSLSALLPKRPAAALAEAGSLRNDPNDNEEADAEAFEKKAHDWFLALNDVQTNMRATVHHLRQLNVPPLTMNASAAARASGQLGAAERGDDLSLLAHFVGTSAASTSAAADSPESAKGKAKSTGSSSDPEKTPSGARHLGKDYFGDDDESASLSLSALRLQERGWKGLSKALEDIDLQRRVESGSGALLSGAHAGSSFQTSSSPGSRSRVEHARVAGALGGNVDAEEGEQETSADQDGDNLYSAASVAAERIKSRQLTSDRRLIDALLLGAAGSTARVDGDVAKAAAAGSARPPKAAKAGDQAAAKAPA